MAASSHRSSFRYFEDHTLKISHSIYVTNFPDTVNSRDLWKMCSAYETVVDVFILLKKSKAGKRFAFVRFIKVNNLNRLVENLCTIWIGRFHLYANMVRFERPHKPHTALNANFGDSYKSSNPAIPKQPYGRANSYVNVVNGVPSSAHRSLISPSPALVLDDSCLVDRDLSKHAMGKVKDFSAIPNLYTILSDEGFSDIKLTYLGGLWIMFEFDNVDTKKNMLKHTGMQSWFHVIQDAVFDFVSDERIVWVDIDGIPLNAWSRETFIKIRKKWGEMIDLEENADNSFGRKWLCIKTKHAGSILESFKVIIKGKVFMIRAKELFTWNPSFVPIKDREFSSKDESVYGLVCKSVRSQLNEEEFAEENISVDDEVHETVFGANSCNEDIEDNVDNTNAISISQEIPVVSQSMRVDQKIVNSSGSVLEVLEDLIKVGQTMGYTMEGCTKDFENIIGRWNGDSIIMGDFNEVWNIDERHGSNFNPSCASRFDQFISNSGLIDVKLEGYSFTWSHPLASKMSKLDRFLVSKGILLAFPSTTAICLDRNLSDHRLILLREICTDFGPTPFRFYHSWFAFDGFDDMIKLTWQSFSHSDANMMIRFKKKLQDLKVVIRRWVNDKRRLSACSKANLFSELGVIDKELDEGTVSETRLLRRLDLKQQLINITEMELKDNFQKSKIKWAVEGNENSKFFMDFIGTDFCEAVEFFFVNRSFSKGCNSTFIALIPKVVDAKFVNDFWPISLIGCVYKVVTKILANRLSSVISDLVSNTQSAFISGRQILDGPFILDEILNWCKRKKKQALFFKVDFAKAYDSIRWDYLLDVLKHLDLVQLGVVGFGALLIMLKLLYRAVYRHTTIGFFICFSFILRGRCHVFRRMVRKKFIRALLLKWVWRFVSCDDSLWCQVVRAMYGDMIESHPTHISSIWCSILRELHVLKGKGFDFWSHCKKRIRNGSDTRFWPVRDGHERNQMNDLQVLLDMVALSQSRDRWLCDLTGNGDFRVKEVRNTIDDLLLPSHADPTRWVKVIPIKINIFAWHARRDCLPTRVNLARRGVHIESQICPVCCSYEEDAQHRFFQCNLAQLVMRRICRWWELVQQTWSSFAEWQSWFDSIRLTSKSRSLLEGVFYVAWWAISNFRNRAIF
nr:RNA-directed DNA polymerase, eukaryota [Tanacetum cinerariifolium]